MNKDSGQKQKAIRFCVANGVIPYLEVLVRYVGDVASVEADITDLDVFGIRPPTLHPETRILFDCKTVSKVSAISRAMWAAGVMRLVSAQESYVILNKAAPEGHRLAANELGVRLTSEALFDNLGKMTSAIYAEGFTYLDDLDAWQKIVDAGKAQPKLTPLVHFLLHLAPLERDACKGLRNLLYALRDAPGEIDSTKPAHRAIWGLVLAEATRFLAVMATRFHHVFDPAMGKPEFEALLRAFVWGGRESYAVRLRMHQLLNEGRSETEQKGFELPGWDRFVDLMRSLLDAPHLVGTGVLPMRDKAVSHVAAPREHAEVRIKSELSSNARARQFLLQTNSYLGSLSKLLRDAAEQNSAWLSTV